VVAGPDQVGKLRVVESLQDVPAREESVHEERHLAADAERQSVRRALPEDLGGSRGVAQVLQRRRGLPVPQFGRVPDLEPESERDLGRDVQSRRVLPLQAYRVAVQLGPNDLEFSTYDGGIEYRSPVPTHHHSADVVAHALQPHGRRDIASGA
jgi:hypothetical protein